MPANPGLSGTTDAEQAQIPPNNEDIPAMDPAEPANPVEPADPQLHDGIPGRAGNAAASSDTATGAPAGSDASENGSAAGNSLDSLFDVVLRVRERAAEAPPQNELIVITVYYILFLLRGGRDRTGSLVMALPHTAETRDPEALQHFVLFATRLAVLALSKTPGVSLEKFRQFEQKDPCTLTDITCAICFDQYAPCLGHDSTAAAKKRKVPLGEEVTDRAVHELPAQEPELLHVPVLMPCGHTFGQLCLWEWLKENNSCPLCRVTVEGTEDPPLQLNVTLLLLGTESAEQPQEPSYFRRATNLLFNSGPFRREEERPQQFFVPFVRPLTTEREGPQEQSQPLSQPLSQSLESQLPEQRSMLDRMQSFIYYFGQPSRRGPAALDDAPALAESLALAPEAPSAPPSAFSGAETQTTNPMGANAGTTGGPMGGTTDAPAAPGSAPDTRNPSSAPLIDTFLLYLSNARNMAENPMFASGVSSRRTANGVETTTMPMGLLFRRDDDDEAETDT